MTPLQVVYDSFLSKMLDDEWAFWTEEEIKQDLYQLLNGAIVWFKFPKVSLEIQGDCFEDNLNRMEIEILATYMKCEWLNRTVLTWENVKPLYEERDFSQANLLDKFKDLLDREQQKAENLEKRYYRLRSGKQGSPFDYTKLAGGNK